MFFDFLKKVLINNGSEEQAEIKLKKSTILKSFIHEPVYSDLAVIDFETTGLSPYKDRIIEIAAVKMLNGEVHDTFITLVNPKISIPKSIIKMTGITNDMVKSAPTIDYIMPELITFIAGLPVAAHNAPFDIGFLEANCNDSINLTIIDTLLLSRKYFPHFENHKLDTIRREMHISSDDAHRALSDCLATAQVYLNCRQQYIVSNRLSSAKAAEKEGNITEAIRLYELMIENNFDGNHPYDRLAILYRKAKDYDNEIRVLLKAIQVFENVVSQERSDRVNKLTKFHERLEKAEQLRSKHINATSGF